MANPTSSIWTKLIDSVEGKNSTRQLAGGIVLGMLIGLMPKDSLLTVLGVIALILSPANLLTAGLSAMVFGVLASWPPIESIMNSLGSGLLGQDLVASLVRNCWSYPLVPWTKINHSAVVGAVLLWGLMIIPVYGLCAFFFNRFGDQIYDSARDSRILCWLVGSKKTRLNEG